MSLPARLQSVRGVIVDMDGLLVDSEPVYRMASQRAIAAQGMTLTDSDHQTLVGLPAREVYRALTDLFGSALDLDRYREDFGPHWRDLVAEGALTAKTGAVELLTFLREENLPFALATSSYRMHMHGTLESAGLAAHISRSVCGDEVAVSKPHPEIVHRAAALIALEAHECVVLEDSHVGVEAALSAGAVALMVPDQLAPHPEHLARGAHVVPDLHVVRTLFETHFCSPAADAES